MKLFGALRGKLESKLAISQTSTHLAALKNGAPITTAAGNFTGYTDPEERAILEAGGDHNAVEAHRDAKADAEAPELHKQLQAGVKLDLTRNQKDALIRFSLKPQSAPASTKSSAPTATATATPSTPSITAKAPTMPIPAPLATAPATGTITAAAFAKTQEKPTMADSEFRKLSHAARNAFIKGGGKLVSDPGPAPRKSTVKGQLYREEFNNLTPAAKSDFIIKQKGKLID